MKKKENDSKERRESMKKKKDNKERTRNDRGDWINYKERNEWKEQTERKREKM